MIHCTYLERQLTESEISNSTKRQRQPLAPIKITQVKQQRVRSFFIWATT